MTDTATEALMVAKQAQRDIEQHEDICAERYAGIHQAINVLRGDSAKIWGFMWKVCGGAFSLIIALLGFMVVQMLNANDAARHDQEAKIDLLQQQLNASRSAHTNP